MMMGDGDDLSTSAEDVTNMESQLDPQTELHRLIEIIESPDIQPEDVRIFEDDVMGIEVSVKVERDEDRGLCTMCHKVLRNVNFAGKDVVYPCITQAKTGRDSKIEEVNSPAVCFDCFTHMQLESLTNNTDALCDKEQPWDLDETYDKHDTYEYKHQDKKFSEQQHPQPELVIKKEKENTVTTKEGRLQLICDACKGIFFTKSDLISHIDEYNVTPEDSSGGYKITNCTAPVARRATAVASKPVGQNSKEKKYKRKVCRKSFLRKHNLVKHEMKKHIGNNGFECRVCHKKLRHQSSLQRHMLIHTGEKPYKCKVCYKRFSYSHCVTEHMREVHPYQTPFQCELCPKAFREKRFLFAHVKDHIFGETNRKMPNVDSVGCARNELENIDLEALYLCDYCKGVFFSKSRLIRHIRTFKTFPHNDRMTKSCDDCVVALCTDKLCSECPKEFTLKEIGRKMDVRYEYHCDKCPISFNNRASFYAHVCSQEISSGKAPKLYQCKVCYKRLAENYTLTRHMRTHTGEKAYQCKCCSIKFAYSQKLYQHMKVKHPEEKPYECEFCPERFKAFRVWRQHMKHSHTSRQCKVCHKIINRDYLKEHMQRHNGIRPLTCDICLNRFVSKNVLVRHMRTHTGEKPYQCKVCLKRMSNNLPAHVKKCLKRGLVR